LAIICSIAISGAAGFMIQRIMRGAIRDRCQSLPTLLMHGGWAAGGMLAMLTFFMLTKGMKKVESVQSFFKHDLKDTLDPIAGAHWLLLVLLLLWVFYGVVIHFSLVVFQKRAAKWVFPVLAIIGMICMGFAFGQNDLANCASPGLAAWNLYKFGNIEDATKVDVERWILFGSGILLLLGMTTKNAQRVTRAEVHTGSMSNTVALYAPRWCLIIARPLVRWRGERPTIAPPPVRTAAGKRMHYDPLRACVILSVSACVIATASSFKFPVSTTYVAFAAVVATGAADRIMQRGDAELKMARAIWVVFSWFSAALIAAVAAGICCLILYNLQVVGMVVAIAVNLFVRTVLKRRADIQETHIREAAREREHPEQFAEYEG
jgi:phosphate/sulfate permease